MLTAKQMLNVESEPAVNIRSEGVVDALDYRLVVEKVGLTVLVDQARRFQQFATQIIAALDSAQRDPVPDHRSDQFPGTRRQTKFEAVLSGFSIHLGNNSKEGYLGQLEVTKSCATVESNMSSMSIHGAIGGVVVRSLVQDTEGGSVLPLFACKESNLQTLLEFNYTQCSNCFELEKVAHGFIPESALTSGDTFVPGRALDVAVKPLSIVFMRARLEELYSCVSQYFVVDDSKGNLQANALVNERTKPFWSLNVSVEHPTVILPGCSNPHDSLTVDCSKLSERLDKINAHQLLLYPHHTRPHRLAGKWCFG